MNYLQDHTLKPEFVKKRLGWKVEKEKITIPIYDQKGNLLYCKYRHLTGDKKFTFDQGNSPTLYPMWLLKDHQEVYLVEGEPDAARMWQEGITAITSVGGVKSFNEDMAQTLAGKTIYLLLDNDEEGQKNIPKYGELLEKVGCNVIVVSLPDDCKDVCEFYAKHEQSIKTLPSIEFKEFVFNQLSSKYQVINNEDFINTEFPPNKWLVKGLLRTPGISPLVGEGGVGKTALSYSLIKAISEGSDWLGVFPTTESKVLILDKENENVDIQQSLLNQGVTSKNVYHYSAKDFNFVNPQTGEPSEQATYLKMFIEREGISVVLMDSLVDFFIGSENDSIMVAQNFVFWRDTFPNCAILAIHHENKPMQGAKKMSAKHRIKGNTHFYNGSQSAISFSKVDEEDDEMIFVEHTKVRGARRHKPFEVKMIVEEHPDDPEETIITGFEYQGEVKLEKQEMSLAYDQILIFLSNHPHEKFTSKQIKDALSTLSERSINLALPKLRKDFAVGSDVTGKSFTYWRLEQGDGDTYTE